MINLIPSALQFLSAFLLWDTEPRPPPSLDFRLRHIHATSNDSRTLLNDVPAEFSANSLSYSLDTRPLTLYKPQSLKQFMSARFQPYSDATLWTQQLSRGPDVEKRETLLTLARCVLRLRLFSLD